jgi:hypothetical protein
MAETTLAGAFTYHEGSANLPNGFTYYEGDDKTAYLHGGYTYVVEGLLAGGFTYVKRQRPITFLILD